MMTTTTTIQCYAFSPQNLFTLTVAVNYTWQMQMTPRPCGKDPPVTQALYVRLPSTRPPFLLMITLSLLGTASMSFRHCSGVTLRRTFVFKDNDSKVLAGPNPVNSNLETFQKIQNYLQKKATKNPNRENASIKIPPRILKELRNVPSFEYAKINF